MALTTRNGRASVLSVGLPFGRVYPDPDGSLAVAGDRQQCDYCYRLNDFVPTRGGTYRRALWSWLRNAGRVRVQWRRVAARVAFDRVARWRFAVANVITAHTFTKTASDDRTFGFDYTDAPEVWDGDSIVSAVSSGTVSGGSGLTFGTPAALVAAFDDIPIDGGLSCRISGGSAGTTYLFAMIATLASGRVLTIPCRMVVVADVPTS